MPPRTAHSANARVRYFQRRIFENDRNPATRPCSPPFSPPAKSSQWTDTVTFEFPPEPLTHDALAALTPHGAPHIIRHTICMRWAIRATIACAVRRSCMTCDNSMYGVSIRLQQRLPPHPVPQQGLILDPVQQVENPVCAEVGEKSPKVDKRRPGLRCVCELQTNSHGATVKLLWRHGSTVELLQRHCWSECSTSLNKN